MKYYLFAILGNIECVFGIFFVLSTMLMTAYIICRFVSCDDEDDTNKLKQLGKWFIPFYVGLTLLGIFVPSQKQLAFIIAAPYVMENKDLQDSAMNTAEIIKMGTEYIKNVLEDKNNGQ